MAEMAESGGGGHDKKGKKRAKKSSTRVDMTPMVDLAFLLLTFFVLTSTFAPKPKIISLTYPAKIDEPLADPPKLYNGLTFVLAKDRIFYYTGQFFTKENPGPNGPTVLTETDFGPQGARKLLADLNSYVLREKKGLDMDYQNKKIDSLTYANQLKAVKETDDALKVLIKTDDTALAGNFIDLLDELRIAEIGLMAPVPITPEELLLLKETIKK